MDRSEWLKTMALLGFGAMFPKEILAAFTDEELKRMDFGADFIWGTATASYQIEGAWNVDGKGESIWDHFVHNTKKVKTRETGDIADDFYHLYNSDIELMHKMNIPASRFSLSWPRILPQGTGTVNQKGIDFYNRVIDKCLKENVTPWITCYHWDLPQALQEKGGWMNRDIIQWFEEYVEICARNFGDRVKNWMVINEPLSFTLGGQLLGMHAPGKVGFKSFYSSVHHVTMAQAAGGRILREHVKDGKIGTTFSCAPVDGWKYTPANIKAAKRVDVVANRLFIEPALGMGYPVKDLPALKHVLKYMRPGDEEKIKFDFDFIGVQNYTRMMAKHFALLPIVHALQIKPEKLGHDLTEMHWEVYPEGMYRIIKQFAAYKGVKEIIITENGAAVKDELVNGEINDVKRLQYIKDYLKYVLKAKKEGINVTGYFIWSFLDNFEWAEGYRPRLGIVGVDFKTQQRTVKASGKWYAEFLKQ
jgi:beta-glucosidase